MRLALYLLLAALSCPASAQETVRWLFPDGMQQAAAAGDRQTVIDLLVDELERCERTDPPADECYDLIVALSHNSRLIGNVDEAIRYGRRATAMAQTMLGASDIDATYAFSELAQSLDVAGRAVEAEPWHRRVLSMREEIWPDNDFLIASAYHDLGNNLSFQKRYDEADVLLRRAWTIFRKSRAPDDRLVAIVNNNIGRNLTLAGRYADAERWLQAAVALLDWRLTGDKLGSAYAHASFAENQLRQGKFGEAVRYYRKAASLFGEVLPAYHYLMAQAWHDLGRALVNDGQAAEGQYYLERALRIRRMTLEPDDERLVWLYSALAASLQVQGKDLASAYRNYGAAADGVVKRLALSGSFDGAQTRMLESFRPIFVNRVAVAWMLNEPGN